MSAVKRVREQAVVYLADRDRALLEELAQETGLSRTELFRRGLWALAAELRAPKRVSAFETLLEMSKDISGPHDLSERSDEYLYGGGYATEETAAVAEPAHEPKRRPRKRGSGRGARSR